MIFNEQFVRVVLTLAGFASATVWALGVRQWSLGEQPLSLRATPPAGWDHKTVLFAFVVWVGVDQILFQALHIGAESTIEERIKVLCLAGGLKFVLLLGWLHVVGGMRLQELCPDRFAWWTDLKIGLWGLFASLLPVWIVSASIMPIRTEKDGHPFIQALIEGADPATQAWIALAVLVVAPLIEELLFRVILQGWLQDHVSPVAAVVAVAVGFAAVHSASWPDPLPLIPLSLVLGYIYYRRRSSLANVVMHALFNGVNLFMALSGES